MASPNYDYIVVGAGSAGSAIASRLSENPARKVLLLEAGPVDRNPWIHIPIGYAKTFNDPRYNWCYETEAEPTLGGRRIYEPRGKTLGGTSSINGMVYIRGIANDFNVWRQLGNAGWSYEDVLPFFKKMESNPRGDDEFHGRTGPLKIGDPAWRNDLSEAYIAAAVEAGLKHTTDFNGASQEGVGYYQLTARNGRRNSSARAYLKPARGRSNLHIVTNALARKIIIKDGVATGVTYQHGNKMVTANANCEVILSGGAVNSPQLLQLSGIGPGKRLSDLGIDVNVDLPGVGENLQDHYAARMTYKINRPLTLNDRVATWPRKALLGAEYILRRTGPLAVGASTVGAFFRSNENVSDPDVQLHFFAFSADDLKEGLHRHSGFSVIVDQHRPESRGTIHIKSSDPNVHPMIQGNYLDAEADQKVLVDAMKFAIKIHDAKPLKDLIEHELAPGINVRSDDELIAYARETGESCYHLSGTCGMGPKDNKMSVLDERLRVRGVGRLRVADASVMPRVISGNTNASCIMIGEKCASMVADDNSA